MLEIDHRRPRHQYTSVILKSNAVVGVIVGRDDEILAVAMVFLVMGTVAGFYVARHWKL